MKYRPLLLRQPHADEMVRAFLEGRKTQFRVPVKPQPFEDPKWGLSWAPKGIANNNPIYCERNVNLNPISKAMMQVGPPLGTIGDQLWLKEAFEICRETCSYECEEYDLFPWDSDLYGDPKDSLKPKCPRGGHRSVVLYRAEEEEASETWSSPIHMPRWASRIDLEITAVRVEMVQAITEEDAKAEGVTPDDYEGYEHPDNPTLSCAAHRYSFRDLWQSIYGTWDTNPWVFAYTVKRIKP